MKNISSHYNYIVISTALILSLIALPPVHTTLSPDTQLVFDYVNQFLLGFRAQRYVPSGYECENNLEVAITDLNYTLNFIQYDDNYLWFEYTFNATQYISGPFAKTFQYCCLSTLQTFNSTYQQLS